MCASMHESSLEMFYHFIMKWKQHVCEIRCAKNAAQCLGIILCNPLSLKKSLHGNICGKILKFCIFFLHCEIYITYSSAPALCAWLFDRKHYYILISPYCYHSNIAMLSLIKYIQSWNGRNITFPVFNFE